MCVICNETGCIDDNGNIVWSDCQGMYIQLPKNEWDNEEPICACNVCGAECSNCI